VNQVRYVLLMITLVALVGVSALALDVPNTFVSGDVISAAEMNANFAAVEAAVSALEAQVAEAQAAQPVVAHAKVDGQISVNSTTMIDVAVVTIDAPAAGVVLVQYTAQAGFSGTTSSNGMAFQIDTDAGGGTIATEYYYIRDFTPANTDPVWRPVAMQRAFQVAAGTHTYRAEASAVSVDGTRLMWNPSITATWYPADSVALSSAISTSSFGGDNLR
jgi:hypothetical protein